MPAPNDTTWGSVVASGSSEGRVGIARTWVDYPTYERATVQVWFWSKYKVSDTSNRCDLAVAIDGANQILVQGDASSVSHPTNTAWSTSNQTLLVEYTIDLPRRKGDYTVLFNCSFQGIEVLGANVMYAQRNYTVYSLESHTVSYNANGGSNTPSSQTKWYGSTLTLTSAKPTRTGYTFLGWGTSPTSTVATYPAGGQYGTDANITLYAVWKPHEYTVRYDANGGTNAPSGQTKLHDTPLPLQKGIPTRQYYNFLGWNTFASATEPLYNAGDTYTNNNSVILYAVWELAYVRPRVDGLKITRCDANGVEQEDGTNAKIVFDWATDKDGSVYAVYFKKQTETSIGGGKQVFLNGNSGSVEALIIGTDGKPAVFDTEFSYDIQLNVADNFGYTPTTRTLNALFLTVDFTEDMKSVCFGEPCPNEEGLFKVAMKNIDLSPKNRLLYKGEVMFGQKELWKGNSLMNETHSITLPKKISEMKNGILLVFARNGDYNIISYFVPKQSIVSFGKTGWCFPLCTGKFDYIGSKTIYIADNLLEGHTDNDATGKNEVSGITYHNEAFYLRYVYEV